MSKGVMGWRDTMGESVRWVSEILRLSVMEEKDTLHCAMCICFIQRDKRDIARGETYKRDRVTCSVERERGRGEEKKR